MKAADLSPEIMNPLLQASMECGLRNPRLMTMFFTYMWLKWMTEFRP